MDMTAKRLGMKTAIAALAMLLMPYAMMAAVPGRVVSFTWEAEAQQALVESANGIEYRITFYRPDVFRVMAAAGGDYADPLNKPGKAQIVIDDGIEATEMTVTEDREQVEFVTSALRLAISKADCRMTLFDSHGSEVWREIEALEIGESCTQTLSTGIDEYYYGGGQQNGYFSHKGTAIDIVADGNWNEGGHPNPAPFYMSSKGYGVLRNTFSVGRYDFSSNLRIDLMHKEERFDAYYFIGDGFDRILDLYTQFTGRPNFVTIWALELGEADCYMTRDKETKKLKRDENGEYVETTDDIIDRLADKYREHDMPGGWLLVNDGYGCGYTNLVEVVDRLADRGFYTGLWTQKGLDNIAWEVGVAGTRLQKLDVAWTGPAYQFSLDANRQAWEALVENSETRGFVWTVQGWAGTQRYSVCWTGDQYGSWDLIRYHIPTLIGSGLSGQAYATTDVDGIFGGSPETYTRDMQWKCFTPVLYAMNGWSHMNKSPWSYEEPYRSIIRKYLKLKMRLTPYMYKYCKDAYDTGAPIVRGMLWNYPEDERTWGPSTQYQYMLGDWLLIAPVYTSMQINNGWRKEDIYLPDGLWIDYWDGRRIEGPVTIDAYPVTLDKLPILVRAGAIIPMYPEMLYNGQKAKDPLSFDIYPHGRSEFVVYEDDGLTRRYQDGEYALQRIEVEAPENAAGDVRVEVGASEGFYEGKPQTRVYQFAIHSELEPEAVFCLGSKLKEISADRYSDGKTPGWHYDGGDRRGIIHVRLPRISTEQNFSMLVDIDESLSIPASPPYPAPRITPELDPSEFVLKCNSNQGGHPIQNAFDGTPETIWHSRWSGEADPPPYLIDIDLGSLRAISGLEYLPRQNGYNGRIADFEIYVSRSTKDWGEPVYCGSFEKGGELQKASFPSVWGEHVRIKILSELNGNQFGSAAEFRLLQDLEAAPLPDRIVYLSDMDPVSAKNGLGPLERDSSNGGMAAGDGRTISVNEQEYEKGLGVHAPSELVYKLDGSWDRLSGHVGMDDEVGSSGSVVFRVFADGKLVFESPIITGESIKQLLGPGYGRGERAPAGCARQR